MRPLPAGPLTGKQCFAKGAPLGSEAQAGLAQFQSVMRSGTPSGRRGLCGQEAEWLKAADCKSARASVRWFESSPVHQPLIHRHPPKAMEIPDFLGYSALISPPMTAPVRLQPEPSVGVMWG